MGYKCCAPMCRGNYKNGPKVSTFKFPDNVELKKKWLLALKRDNFIPTKHTRVCEKHFKPDEIIRQIEYFDERRGITLTAPLDIPRLAHDAVPFILLDYHHSKTFAGRRTIRDERRLKLGIEEIEKATTESIICNELYDERKSFSSFTEFLVCLEENKSSIGDKWLILKREENVLFLLLNEDPVPKIEKCVVVDYTCCAKVFHFDVEMHAEKLSNINVLERILEDNSSYIKKSDAVQLDQCIAMAEKLFHKMIDLVSNEQKGLIEFVLEQLHTIPKKKRKLEVFEQFS